MNPKIIEQVMRGMEAQACSAPRKGISLTRAQVRSGAGRGPMCSMATVTAGLGCPLDNRSGRPSYSKR